MLQAGARIGPYTVVSPLGAGGMGEVYRAEDARLRREVAVKVLHEQIGHGQDRLRRFEREARTTAALNHPNILAVYDVGTHEGQPYIVTELLEGKTLRQLIADGLTVRKAVELATDIAHGLAAAHERGVIHRDLKPGNVLVTRDGVVKILDFGLAKLAEADRAPEAVTGSPTEETATGSGVAVGTAGYMAPEQVRGYQVDHRADIFALGCVLYEMLSGRRAFKADTPVDTAAAILSNDPPPLSGCGRPVPGAVERIVARCLEKRPDDRFDSARDVAFALQAAGGALSEPVSAPAAERPRRSIALSIPLWVAVVVTALLLVVAALQLARRWVAQPALPAAKHVAVMRFTAEGKDPGVQALASGLTEVVAGGLALIEQETATGLWVVPPAEARQRDVRTIEGAHQKYNVTVALIGRLRRRGDHLHLALAALDPATGRAMRTAIVEDSASNLSSFQDGLVLRIAGMLGVDVSEETSARLAAMATTVPQAFQAYLEALAAMSSPEDAESVTRAIALLETATAQDPLFTSARVALGRACLKMFDVTNEARWLDRALAEAQRAVERDHRPDSYRLLAAVQKAGGHLPEAVASLERAARAGPSDADVHVELAAAYEAADRPTDAEHELQRAVFLRPGYWPPHHLLALLHLAQGRYEAAATQWREVVSCAPEWILGYNNLGAVYFFLGQTDQARETFERSIAIEPSRYALSNLGTLYFDDARFADAAAVLERAVAQDDTSYRTWGNLAFAYKFGDKPEKAGPTFRRAVELAKAQLAASPGDPAVTTYLADYYAMLDQPERGRQLMEPVLAANPADPQLIADIAECLWDLGDRDRALDWVRRAFAAGVQRRRFERRPTLRDLVADERYQSLIQELGNRT